MADFTTLTAIASGVNSSIKILEVTYLLKAVGEQTTDLLRTTEHVDRNVNEARRLLRLKTALISHDERVWMDCVIEDAQKALLGVAQLIEPARADVSARDSIRFGNRVLWVFRDSPKVRDKHNRLSICNQSLMTVVGGLYAKDVVVVTPMQETKGEDQPPPYEPEMEALLNWRRKRKKSVAGLKSDGFTINPIPPSSESVTTIPTHISRLMPTTLPELSTETFAKEALGVYHQARDSRRPLTSSPATSDAVPRHFPEFEHHDLESPKKREDIYDEVRMHPWSQYGISPEPRNPPALPIPTDTAYSTSPTMSELIGSYTDLSSSLTSPPPMIPYDGFDGLQVCEHESEQSTTGSYCQDTNRLGRSQTAPELNSSASYVPSRKKDRGWLAYCVARSDVGHSLG